MDERLSVPEAAKRLNISEGALRQRINRGTIEHEKDHDGRVYVFVQDIDDVQHGEQYGDMTPIVEILRDEVGHLRRQLDEEREANRKNRRLLAAALERIPELEPSEAPQSPLSSSGESDGSPLVPDGEDRRENASWWRRFFGVGS
jgi:hypothetical protein